MNCWASGLWPWPLLCIRVCGPASCVRPRVNVCHPSGVTSIRMERAGHLKDSLPPQWPTYPPCGHSFLFPSSTHFHTNHTSHHLVTLWEKANSQLKSHMSVQDRMKPQALWKIGSDIYEKPTPTTSSSSTICLCLFLYFLPWLTVLHQNPVLWWLGRTRRSHGPPRGPSRGRAWREAQWAALVPGRETLTLFQTQIDHSPVQKGRVALLGTLRGEWGFKKGRSCFLWIL